MPNVGNYILPDLDEKLNNDRISQNGANITLFIMQRAGHNVCAVDEMIEDNTCTYTFHLCLKTLEDGAISEYEHTTNYVVDNNIIVIILRSDNTEKRKSYTRSNPGQGGVD